MPQGWCQRVRPRLSVLGYKRICCPCVVKGVNRVTVTCGIRDRCGAGGVSLTWVCYHVRDIQRICNITGSPP
jgi:hypothetical protein